MIGYGDKAVRYLPATGHRESLMFTYINIALLILWLFLPLVSTVFICLYLGTCRMPRPAMLFYLFILAMVPSCINFTKQPVEDLAAYNQIFDALAKGGIETVYKQSVLDPGFYYSTWVLAKVSGGYTPVFVLFWSSCSYFLLFVALLEFDDLFVSENRGRLAAIVFFTIFIGIEFGLTGHLVRQCFALAVSMLGLVRMISGRPYKVLFLAAFLCHLSTIVFLPVLILVNLPRKRRTVFLVALFIAGIIIGQTNLLEFATALPGMNNQFASTITDKAGEYLAKNDGDITTRMMVEAVAYILIALYFAIRGISAFSDRTNEALRKFCLFMVTFAIFILFMRNNSLLLLRYFFYLAYFNLFLLLTLSRLKNFLFYGLFVLFVATAPYRFFGLLKLSNYRYISNSLQLLRCSIPEMLTYWV